jgi:aerobic carbon-monoxide dehydrogenase small subunit
MTTSPADRPRMRSSFVSLEVNGRSRELLVEPGTMLVDVVRDALGLTGTKYGCGQGGCGACTVLVDGRAMLSCLLPAELADGASVVTIEGLETPEGLHPIQESFVDKLAAQCGFCTPGMIIAAKALLDRVPDPTREQVVEAIAGNVCRCTGYEPIVEAILDAAARLRAQPSS